MIKAYKLILEKAIPYYEKGRPGDIEHIKWLYETIPKFIKPKEVDYDILMPVAILHDTGYSKVPKGASPLNLDIRKLHSEEGAKIAEEILTLLKYNTDKTKEIKRLITKHDNWAFGDSFADEPTLLAFQNFDFMWVASEKGFPVYQKIRGMNPKDTYHAIEKAQEENEKRGTKWFNKETENYYHTLMLDREKQI